MRGAYDETAVARRARDAAAVVLAVVSGATDAIGFLALGGAFTSVMTGNMVLLGISAARADGELAGHAAAAIACFVLGCAVGARVAGSSRADDPVWPAAVTRALAVEGAVLCVYAAAWWATGSAPGSGLQLVLLVLNAFALGVQSSTIQRFGVSGLSTTYMTGTLTTLVVKIAAGRHPREVAHSGAVLAALIAGAALGGGVVLHVPVAGPVCQLAGVGVALLLGLVATRRSRPGRRAARADAVVTSAAGG